MQVVWHILVVESAKYLTPPIIGHFYTQVFVEESAKVPEQTKTQVIVSLSA